MRKVFLFVLLVLFISSGCSSYSIVSSKLNQQIKIDGKLNDWNGKLKYFKDEKMAVGVLNDPDNLYISLSTADKGNIIKILKMGFTIWFEPGNEKGETIGIQYPIKKERAMPERFVKSNRNPYGSKIIEKMINNIRLNNSEYLVFNDDSFPLGAYSLTDKNGVKIGLGYNTGRLVYELKIPNRAGKYFPLNLTALDNNNLMLKFSTSKPEKPLRENVSASPRIGKGSRTGGMRRGRRRRPQARNSAFTDPIEFEVKVTLSR